ncbi:lysine transporter LysE [Psychromonas marina]|uniref:Lysine transporter LysE n=1 Tax=Psychromonas marina TaxID=88364 RepID=A0ABQ6E4F7_9GAMM|nr:LysE family transporter [Psychromonas marina]GLS92063.1 lysine transporter LysE [Psychromonas marina]
MPFDVITYLPEIISVTVIAIFMSISPGADFVMVTKNSLFHDRKAGLYSALGISLAIWMHVTYSIAGLAIVIANSPLLFSLIKYLGGAYLVYMGWKTFQSGSDIRIEQGDDKPTLSNFSAFKTGVITNALNPKTTIFFLSIFTQVITPDTPILIQLLYGAIISIAHLLWFSLVAICVTHPLSLTLFNRYKVTIERVIGVVLIGFGLKVAFSTF